MRFSSRITTLIFAAATALVSCSGSLWELPAPGSVIAESYSPNKSLLARIIAAEAQGKYTIEVCDVRKGDVIDRRTIVAPVGYHKHIVSLSWGVNGQTVTATIDHDFGEDNRAFDLHVEIPDA